MAYSPAMPVIELGVSQPGRRQPQRFVTALIDSGADGTLLPLDILEAVGAGYVGEAIIRGISGSGKRASMYLASLRIESQTLHAIRVVAIPEGTESILGRNALQYLTVTLDGPAGVTGIGQ